jgi:3-isopropylmalate dehydrogenase
MSAEARVGVMRGDFIGPVVTEVGSSVIQKAAEIAGTEIEIVPILASGDAYEATGGKEHLPQTSIETALQMDAILKGPFGGPVGSTHPKWSGLERKSVLALRKALGVYANLRPVRTLGEIGAHLSPLKKDSGGSDRDLMIVRELTGGAYYGESDEGVDPGTGERWAYEKIEYKESQVERIIRAAIKVANERGDKLTLVDKSNVLKKTGKLWNDVFNELTDEAGIETGHFYVDDASARILRRFTQGTIVSYNEFGDILSDENAETIGAIGLGGSASLGDDNFGIYEPIGGSAADIEDVRDANPIGTIMSVALMFRHSLGRPDIADLIEQSVEGVMNEYHVTKDLVPMATDGLGGFIPKVVNAYEFGDLVLGKIESLA